MEENSSFCFRALLRKWMLEKAEYTMSRFARMYGMEYVGMATNEAEAKKLSEKI